MPSETIPALLAERRADAADVTAIVGDDDRATYAQLDDRSAHIAAELIGRGLNKGHRTALLMPNSVDWAGIAYAVMRVGGVLVPLSTLLRPAELQRQLAIAGVRHLIVCDAHRGRDFRADLLQLDHASLPSLSHIWWWSELEPSIQEAADLAMVRALESRVRPADDMAVIFTSGSSGAPKGVIHTHGAAVRATRAGTEQRGVVKGVRLYSAMPFFWVGGLGTALLGSLISGATLLTERTPEPEHTLRFLEREGATLFRSWRDQAVRIAQHPAFATADLSALSAGSLDPLLPPEMRSLPGRRANLFGMTESFGPLTGWPLDRDMPEAGWGSCGKPLEGAQVRIVDPQSNELLPPGEVGAIQISGPNILRGICGREREEVFTPDGWYDTGDFGCLNEAGFLFWRGRRDDMFKVNGASVFPSEVEAALLTIPGVHRAFVADLEIDGGAVVGAAVLPDQGGQLELAALARAARDRLSAYKAPTRWVVLRSLDELPMLSSGKIDRTAFRRLLTGGARVPGQAASADRTATK